MRITIPIKEAPPFNWQVLRNEPLFLYRRVADRDRAVLCVGAAPSPAAPLFHGHRAADWYYGHMLYELKNELEHLTSRHRDPSGLPLRQWVVPRWVVEWRKDGVFLHVMEHDRHAAASFVEQAFRGTHRAQDGVSLAWEVMTGRDRYLSQADYLLQKIQRGDIYEINYCIERRAAAAGFDPYASFERLLLGTNAPFAAFHRHEDHFALCASPERFLHFNDDRVIAQPMKGTRPRSADPLEDTRLAMELRDDAKERGENIMALDVARHDLSRVAASGTVRVEELCAVHAHDRVHQMVSTVSARIREGVTPMDVVLSAFPMASMTGAPKIEAMRLIDSVEDQARGPYSGTLGFFAPDGTADLNVVIRTVLYDQRTNIARLRTGSALTAACDPRKEWEECGLKAHSIIEALG